MGCVMTEVFRCTDTASCTFLAEATEEDGSCLYADAIGTCGGDCALDVDGNGVCDTDDAAHCGPGTHWDVGLGLCVISCPADLNLDGAIAIGDLLDLLSQFATYCRFSIDPVSQRLFRKVEGMENGAIFAGPYGGYSSVG